MCEQDPEAAMAINIPRSVVEWLLSQDMSIPPLLIHLSSDQGKFPLAYKVLPKTKKNQLEMKFKPLSSLLFSMVFQAGLFLKK
jgi:hypothetical protein